MSEAVTGESTPPLRYHGYSAHYVDIAKRGTDEHVGLSIVYAPHSKELGCFVVRFVAHGSEVKPQGFTHLTYREPGSYRTFGEHAKTFRGVRLNKFAIKAFSPAIYPYELEEYLFQFNLLPMLEEWIAEQMVAEGFTVTVDLAQEIRTQLIPPPKPPPPVTEGPVSSVLAFPDLTEAEKPAKKPVLALVEPEGDDEDEDEEDGDEDEDKDEEDDWLK